MMVAAASAVDSNQAEANSSGSTAEWPKLDENEMINQKFGIILQLLSKFSFINLTRLLESTGSGGGADLKSGSIADICIKFVDININFLTDLNLEGLNSSPQPTPASPNTAGDVENNSAADACRELMAKRDQSLRLIIDQCIDNFVSVLNVGYPFYFSHILKQCLEFSSRPFAAKYGTRHLARLATILQQNEVAGNLTAADASRFLTRVETEATFKYLAEFVSFERAKFRSQKRSFYSHWAQFSRPIARLYNILFMNYYDKFVARELKSATSLSAPGQVSRFGPIIDSLFVKLIDVFACWIEPASVLEVTGVVQVNVKEIYEHEVSSVGARDEVLASSALTMPPTTPQSAVLILIDSFLDTFNSLLQRFTQFASPNLPDSV